MAATTVNTTVKPWYSRLVCSKTFCFLKRPSNAQTKIKAAGHDCGRKGGSRVGRRLLSHSALAFARSYGWSSEERKPLWQTNSSMTHLLSQNSCLSFHCCIKLFFAAKQRLTTWKRKININFRHWFTLISNNYWIGNHFLKESCYALRVNMNWLTCVLKE